MPSALAEVARELGARTLAFPAISCGHLRLPAASAAARVAVAAVAATSLDLVRFVLFGDETYEAFARAAVERG